jgi:hypothetical protein
LDAAIRKRTYNGAVIAGLILLAPPVIFWSMVLLYRAFGIGREVMGVFAALETSPKGRIVVVTAVVGCPFFALPLTVIGRWLTMVRRQKGISLANAVLAVCVLFLVLGLVLPLGLR